MFIQHRNYKFNVIKYCTSPSCLRYKAKCNNFVFLFQLSPKIWTFLQQMGAIFHQVQLLAPFTKAMSCVLLANLAVENLFLELLGTMDLMLYLVSSRKSIKICKIEMILRIWRNFPQIYQTFFLRIIWACFTICIYP